MREAGKKWIERCRQKELHRAVIEMYERYLRNHIDPYFGKMLISKLTIPEVRKFQDWLLEEWSVGGHGPPGHCLLGAIVSDAQERGFVARNPVAEMKRNQPKRGRQI